MGKKIYVNGNIIIKTRYFKFKDNCGACYREPPEGTEIWEANKIENGSKFFEITDKNPQSIFNDYYAKGGFTTYDSDIKRLKAKGAGFFEQKVIYNVLRES